MEPGLDPSMDGDFGGPSLDLDGGDDGDSALMNSKVLGVAAAIIVAVGAAGAWFFLGSSDDVPTTTDSAPTTAAEEPAPCRSRQQAPFARRLRG